MEANVTQSSPVVGIAVPMSVGSLAGATEESSPLEPQDTFEQLLGGALQDQWARCSVLPSGLGPH